MKIKRFFLIVLSLMIMSMMSATGAEEMPQSLSMYSVKFLDEFSVESVDQLCNLIFPQGYEGDLDYAHASDGERSMHRYGNVERGDADLYITAHSDGLCELEFRVSHEEGEVQFDYNDTVSRLEGTPCGCTMSEEEAARKGGEIVAAMNAGMVCTGIGKVRGEIISDSFDTLRSDQEAYYLVYSRRDLLPLAALSINNGSYYDWNAARKTEYFRMTMTDAGIDSFVYSAPVQSVKETGKKDIISVEEAIQLTKKYLAQDKKATLPQNADDMKLGYYLFHDKKDEYSYIPVWCYYDRTNTTPDIALCIIKAESGEVISQRFN